MHGGEAPVDVVFNADLARVWATIVSVLLAFGVFSGSLTVSYMPIPEEYLWSQSQSALLTNVAGDPRASIKLERSGCFGPCPVYTLTMEPSGVVTFEGEFHVCAEGSRSRQVDPKLVAQLAAGLSAIRFPDFVRTEALILDAPRTTVSLTQNGVTKNATFQLGFGRPSSDVRLLLRIADRIDSLARAEEWVGTYAGINAYCINEVGEVTRQPGYW